MRSPQGSGDDRPPPVDEDGVSRHTKGWSASSGRLPRIATGAFGRRTRLAADRRSTTAFPRNVAKHGRSLEATVEFQRGPGFGTRRPNNRHRSHPEPSGKGWVLRRPGVRHRAKLQPNRRRRGRHLSTGVRASEVHPTMRGAACCVQCRAEDHTSEGARLVVRACVDGGGDLLAGSR